MRQLETLSAFRLTIVGGIVVMVLSVAVVTIFSGGPQGAAPYLGLVATAAVPALLALGRSEQTARNVDELHTANAAAIAANTATVHSVTDKLDSLARALGVSDAPPPGQPPRPPSDPSLGGTH